MEDKVAGYAAGKNAWKVYLSLSLPFLASVKIIRVLEANSKLECAAV